MVNLLAYTAGGAAEGFGSGLEAAGKAARERRQRREDQDFQRGRDQMSIDARAAESDRDRAFRAEQSRMDRDFRSSEAATQRDFQADQKAQDRAAADARSRRSGGGIGTLTTDAEGNMIRVKGSKIEYVTDAEGNKVKKAANEDPTLAARELYRKTYDAVAGDAMVANPEEIHREVEKMVGFTLDDLNQGQGAMGIGSADTPRGSIETTPNGRTGSGGAPGGAGGMVQVNSQVDLERLLKSGAIKPGDTIMTPGGPRKVPADG